MNNITILKPRPRPEDIVIPPGKFKTIVCDPPWPMKKIVRKVSPNQVGFDYATMSEKELMDYPLVSEKAADEAHLWLWTTQKFLPRSLKLVGIWGFDYYSCFIWRKNGGFQPFGCPQFNHEPIILARRGRPAFLSDAFAKAVEDGYTLFCAKRREHSRKPDEFYDIVRRACPGPRLDMFSREPREGFEQHGNELNHFSPPAQRAFAF
jgi:N6-adenosine-specific RNA methylase IME4